MYDIVHCLADYANGIYRFSSSITSLSLINPQTANIRRNIRINSDEGSSGTRKNLLHLPAMSIPLTPRLQQAITQAATSHDGHYRKGSTKPYVTHVVSVMLIASEYTGDEDILVACLLHDIMEDRPDTYSFGQMAADFGPRVVDLVQGVTKDSTLPDWRARSDAYLAHLRQAGPDVALISLSDKYHNLTSILADYEQLGDALWDRFNAGKPDQQWWYTMVLAAAEPQLPDGHPLVARYREQLQKLQGL